MLNSDICVIENEILSACYTARAAEQIFQSNFYHLNPTFLYSVIHTHTQTETVVQHSAHHTDFSHHSVSLSSSDTDE